MLQSDLSPGLRWAIAFLGLIGLVWTLNIGQGFIVPIVIALMVTTAVWPAVEYLMSFWGLPRALSALVVLLGLLGGTCLGILWGGLAILEIAVQLPPPNSWFMPAPTIEIPAEPEQGQERPPPRQILISPYQRVHQRSAEINRYVADQLFPEDYTKSPIYVYLAPYIEEQSKRVLGHVAHVSEQILLILVLVLFLLIEGDMLMRRTAEIFGPSSDEDRIAATTALSKMARGVRSYLWWRTIINIVMTLVLGVIYKYLLGMSYPWAWAILAGVLTYIPYIGPVIAFLPTFLDALFSPAGGIWTAAAVLVIYTLILFAEGYIVFPLVIGRSMEMNATTVLLGCLFWGLVWGPVGLFLAMPLMGAIRAICQSVPGWSPWANLMGMEANATGRAGWVKRAWYAVANRRPSTE